MAGTSPATTIVLVAIVRKGEPALLDFEVVLAANFADMVDIGAHGFREYFGSAADDFEAVGRQGLDHILIGKRDRLELWMGARDG